MFDLLREYQLNIMLVLGYMSGLVAFFVCVTTTLQRNRRLVLLLVEISATFLIIFDRFAYFYRGDTSDTGYWMVRISNFIVYIMTLLVLFSFNLYIKELFKNEGGMETVPKRLKWIDIELWAGMGLVVISQFTGLYYTFDSSNHYQRAPGFILSYIVPCLALIGQLSAVIQYRKKFTIGIRISLLLFTIAPLIASVVQFFVYGISLMNITAVAIAIQLYIFVLIDMNAMITRANRIEIDYLKEQQKSMQKLFEQTATALVNAIDAKDTYTHGHSSRVAHYSRKIAESVGKSEQECEEIYYAALLHDVGKIGIADTIINKNGKLTAEEYAEIKKHPEIGGQILSSIMEFPYLSIGANYHHERFDGKGYHEKLKGYDIPEIARIVSVADAYDAMTSKRSYRDPIPQQSVREEFVKGMGTQFDPKFARTMLHLIDLDSEYEMKEKEEVKELAGKSELECDEFMSDVSEGIVILREKTQIHLRSSYDETGADASHIPSIVLFDSLDGRVYDDNNDKMRKEMVYLEYAYIRFDGKTECKAARKIKVDVKPREIGKVVKKFNDSVKGKLPVEYNIEAVKFKDHVMLTITSIYQIVQVIVALPDNTRYAYAALTGEHCRLWDVNINKSGESIDENYIPRIAEEVSFINVPAGDIPNIQIDSYRTACSDGIPVTDGLRISFHTMSLPTARLVWHCPFLNLFYSDNHKIDGPNYIDFALIRIDGENWEASGLSDNRMIINKTDSFEGWDVWKEANKKGFDCEVTFKRKGNRIETQTENAGLAIKNITTLSDEIDKVYVALTGDQCAITNIRIKHGK